MLRTLALVLALLMTGPVLAAAPPPAARSPLACDASQPGDTMQALCALPQVAANSCSQTCYDDQNICHQGCDKANKGSNAGHEKCMATCTTTYGRCQTRCNQPQNSRRPSQ